VAIIILSDGQRYEGASLSWWWWWGDNTKLNETQGEEEGKSGDGQREL
jgi:hypothetical protein